VRPATSAGRETIAKVLLAVSLRSHRLAERALRDVDALQIPERQGAVRVLSPRLIETAHRHGAEVHVWTINDASEIKRLADLGCDGIVTDCADVALRILGPASL
jgi:glycerophosphoryl diester phosphodiesterase